MPGEDTNDQSDEFEDTDDSAGESTDETSGDAGGDAGKTDDKAPTTDAKRIADLQSKFDQATARANKAEKLLTTRGEKSASGSNDPQTSALMAELREASLDAVYGEHPELREYQIDRVLIEGATRAEMRESASALVGLIKNVTTKARNKALADAGVEAPPPSGTRSKPVDYGSMSEEDFKKVLASI